jgi:hypothetical protein
MLPYKKIRTNTNSQPPHNQSTRAKEKPYLQKDNKDRFPRYSVLETDRILLSIRNLERKKEVEEFNQFPPPVSYNFSKIT